MRGLRVKRPQSAQNYRAASRDVKTNDNLVLPLRKTLKRSVILGTYTSDTVQSRKHEKGSRNDFCDQSKRNKNDARVESVFCGLLAASGTLWHKKNFWRHTTYKRSLERVVCLTCHVFIVSQSTTLHTWKSTFFRFGAT